MTDSPDSPDRPDSDEPIPPERLAGLPGMDLVRRTLEEARDAARSQGKDTGRQRGPALPRGVRGRRRRWSGPGPDQRDPQPLGSVTRDVTRARGWSGRVAEGTLLTQWRSVVGDQIADHATPTALRDGVLLIAAESTAWATQLRMMQAAVLAKIAAAFGDGVVTALKITGPAAPSWRKGPRHIKGRGPRDTYG